MKVEINNKTPNEILLDRRNTYIKEFDGQYRTQFPEYTPFQRACKITGDLMILHDKGELSKTWTFHSVIKIMKKLGIYN
jgi:hypothetical protein